MSDSHLSDSTALTLDAIHAAHRRIRDKINRTAVLTSETLDAGAGAKLFFKCENLQKVGAFKARGATNAVFSMTDAEAARGVATHSSGNHAAALARAARLRGIPAFIVMPENSPKAKVASVRRYGGEVITCKPTLAAREETAAAVIARTGATLVHPYDDLRVMAGQGTATVELLADVPELDVLLCPVGGGGLLSGSAVAAKALNRSIQVVAVEPAGADDARRSFEAGRLIAPTHIDTVADGLRTGLSERTFAHIRRHVDRIVTVPDDVIVSSMRTLWEVMKLIVEPSGAVSYAAVAGDAIDVKGKRVGIILTGGNLDLDRLPWQSTP